MKPLQELNKLCFGNQVRTYKIFLTLPSLLCHEQIDIKPPIFIYNCTVLLFCCCLQFTLLLSWSNLEAGRYLETLKAYENKPTASIQEKVEDEFLPQITKVMKNIPSVNKTDVLTMLQGFQNLRGKRYAAIE